MSMAILRTDAKEVRCVSVCVWCGTAGHMASMVQWDIEWHEQATAALKFQVLQLFLNCTVRFEREKKTRLVLYCVEILSSERRNAASRLTLPDAAGTRSRRFAPVTDVGAAR